MRTNPRPVTKTIASYVSPRTFAPGARDALERLGYSVVSASAMRRIRDDRRRPMLHLVDERRLDEFAPSLGEADAPLVLVGSARRGNVDDERVVGRISRPIEVRFLYPILQRVLEHTPRATPRVSTQLAARGMRGDRRWVGHVTSLSEGGCYFESSERPPVGATISVQLALPRSGIVTARAVCARVRDDGAGLAFTESSEEARREIEAFVTGRLAAA